MRVSVIIAIALLAMCATMTAARRTHQAPPPSIAPETPAPHPPPTPPATNTTAPPAPAATNTSAPPAEWNYVKEGADWTGVCSTGRAQSPINLANPNSTITFSAVTSCGVVQPSDYRLALNYKRTDKLKWINNGHTLQIDGDFGTAVFRNKTFNVKQLHFHTKSEHQIDGQCYPLEMHIVHAADDATLKLPLLVVGVLFKKGARNQFLDEVNIGGKTPQGKADAAVAINSTVDLFRLNGTLNGGFYYYEGSLTTPPCSESVNWFVFQRPQEADGAQLRAVAKLFQEEHHFPKGNRRAVQPLNGRAITSVSCRGVF